MSPLLALAVLGVVAAVGALGFVLGRMRGIEETQIIYDGQPLIAGHGASVTNWGPAVGGVGFKPATARETWEGVYPKAAAGITSIEEFATETAFEYWWKVNSFYSTEEMKAAMKNAWEGCEAYYGLDRK